VPTVAELTEPYGNFMLGPRSGPDVCVTCFNFTRGYRHCYACAHNQEHLDAVAPISYSVAHEQLHHALAQYKRASTAAAARLQRELAAVLWRFLAEHEQCVARAAGTSGFELVTTIPSSDPIRDERHPLRAIVAELIRPTRDRHDRLLKPAQPPAIPRQFDPNRFTPTKPLNGQAVLLIDDTWTSGASAQSAAAALKNAGAETVAAVVIGRHLNRDWHENDTRLRGIGFEWSRCALCPEDRARNSE
jgi:predicted amidophosphoribosyltransferase